MPIRIDTPSRFSALRADDKPVYLNSKGAIRTGKSLQGRLVSIAESLGIFKGYVASYHRREAVRNHDVYVAVWNFVNDKHGFVVGRRTQKAMKDKGYPRAGDPADTFRYQFQGGRAKDPQRTIVGRELRLILDTARGIDQTRQEAIEQMQESGTVVLSDAERAAQRQRWVPWTGEVATANGAEVPETVVAPESPGNVDGIAESLQGLEMLAGSLTEAAETRDGEVAEASIPGPQVDEVGSKPARAYRELGRAMVAGNKELLHEMLGDETQLRKLAQEFGYDPETIVSRRGYIQGKLESRLGADPRARSGRLTPDEIHELVRAVFDKALGKRTVVAGIRGAILGATSKVKHALDEDSPGQVDILELSKDKIKAAARDKGYLKKLMVAQLDTQDQDISAARMGFIEQRAIKEATVLVQKARVELSAAEVDDILAHTLRSAFDVGESRAWLGGVLSKAARTVKPERYGYKRSIEDVLEKAADEKPRVPVEAADERAKALHEAQRQPEQPGQANSPSVKESVTSPSQRQDSPEPAAVAAPSPASFREVSLPRPQSYKGVDYFDRSDKGISRLPIAVRNHQAARQVAVDDIYLAASVPEGRRESELTPAHREYIKTTLLRHVAEHERTRPGVLLAAGDLHLMMRPITARALEMQSGRKLGAKVLYKNITKHLGRKDAVFGDALKKLRRDARNDAGTRVGVSSSSPFVQRVARKADINIKVDPRVLSAIRPQVKDMAEAYVNDNRKVLTTPALEDMVQTALRGYIIAARFGGIPPP